MSLGLTRSEVAAATAARESFASGVGDLAGVRPAIALSWSRCRDSYAVDPRLALAPPAVEHTALGVAGRGLDPSVVLTELGGWAGRVQARLDAGVVTVVDAGGRLVGAWGDGVPDASEARLAPWHSWSETTTGTNGMGTALHGGGLTAVWGPEHWCAGFHSLDCLGVAIQDAVTHDPIAAVNISTPTGTMPELAPSLLRSVRTSVEGRLGTRAHDQGRELVGAFTVAAAGRPTLVVDLGGRVVVADRAASRLLGVPGEEPLLEPARRVRPDLAEFDALVSGATASAWERPGWTGTGRLSLPHAEEPVASRWTAVFRAGQPIGFLVAIGAEGEELLVADDRSRAGDHQVRVVAHRRGSGTVILQPSEIRYARADGNTVWLFTDRGRLRTAERGLTRLETQLAGHGFARVHRSYLVRLDRVREVHRGVANDLLLFVDGDGAGEADSVPVSRGRQRQVRSLLGT
jgi:transcriptional regulator of acetoin/glycerol metabolism